MEPLEETYFRWLCEHVQRVENPTPSTTRWNLLRHLHSTQYVYLAGHDDNRAEDGVELRRYFHGESRIPRDPSWEHLPCSVLEMLVALAGRAHFNAMIENDPAWWFWHFIDNLNIDTPDSQMLDVRYIDQVLERWMYRQYTVDGEGGLFPLEHSRSNQREVETWYQLMAYLEEKGW